MLVWALLFLFSSLGAAAFGVVGLGAMQVVGTLADSVVLSTGETVFLAGSSVTGAAVGALLVLMTPRD